MVALRSGRSVATLALLGLLTAGSPTRARADRVTANGSSGGCDSWSFDASNDPVPPVALPGAVVLSMTLVQRCPGTVQVRATFGTTLTPTAVQAAQVLAFVRATCTGGGCDVAGTFDPLPGSGGAASRAKGLAPTVATFPVVSTFVDLPAGTYTLEVLVGGVNGQLLAGQAYAVGSGTAPGADRPGSP
jgi:hypothetical protein